MLFIVALLSVLIAAVGPTSITLDQDLFNSLTKELKMWRVTVYNCNGQRMIMKHVLGTLRTRPRVDNSTTLNQGAGIICVPDAVSLSSAVALLNSDTGIAASNPWIVVHDGRTDLSLFAGAVNQQTLLLNVDTGILREVYAINGVRRSVSVGFVALNKVRNAHMKTI